MLTWRAGLNKEQSRHVKAVMPVFLAILLTLVSTVAYGQVLFGIAEGMRLVKLDPSTAVMTLVGPIGFDIVSGLAIHSSGAMFATAGGATMSFSLVRIDPDTGVGTVVGALENLPALAPDSAGTLFGVTFSRDFITINPSNGEAALVDSTGLTRGHVGAMAFTPAGVLLGVWFDPGNPMADPPVLGSSQLVSLDPTTGAATVLTGPLRTDAGTVFVEALAVDQAGTLFGIICNPNAALVQISQATGYLTVVNQVSPVVTCIGTSPSHPTPYSGWSSTSSEVASRTSSTLLQPARSQWRF